jgi:hypothetical protein
MWYAQSYPEEDCAETFAVRLNPQSRWRERYVDWSALRKLEYMEQLMASFRTMNYLHSSHHRVV